MINTLILGAGPSWKRREDNVHNDIFVDILEFQNMDKSLGDTVHDLNITPWPFADNSYEEIAALHLVEHLNNLVVFMNECWRVLKPGGALFLTTPEAGSNPDLTHADPTHVRCYRKHSFINYFTPSEAPKFGYTDKYWALWDLLVVDGVIHLHAMPLKKEIVE